MASSSAFKGNKTYLQHKTCVQCGREMTWRKAWARNWQQLKYCSHACRNKSRLAVSD